MGLWDVQSGDTTVQVEAANWLAAVGKALPTLGIAQKAMVRFVCELHADGVAHVKDTQTGALLVARSLDPTATPPSPDLPPLVLPVPMLLPVLSPGAILDELTDTGRYVPPAGLANHLSAAEERVDAARTHTEACERAVDALTGFIPAESSAVLLVDGAVGRLRFAVAKGPHSKGVLGMEIPLGQGIAGYVADTGSSVIVLDARTNPKHYDAVDRRTGYRTQDMLAAAIRLDGGHVIGVLELLNPPKTFVPWNLEAACAVADTLARRLTRA